MSPVINPIQRIEGQTFVGAQVQLDGGCAYVRCHFVNCTLMYLGLGPVQLEGSTLENCQVNFGGPALNTFSFLKTIFASGQQQIVETIFQEIRRPEAGAPATPPTKKTPIQ